MPIMILCTNTDPTSLGNMVFLYFVTALSALLAACATACGYLFDADFDIYISEVFTHAFLMRQTRKKP
jgi:hypothetical protein